MNWEQVMRTTWQDDVGKWDAEGVNVEEIQMEEDGRLCFRAAGLGERSVEPSHLALSQLCGRLDLPVRYARRIPPTLRARCVNHDLARVTRESGDKRYLLRCKGDLLRAFLSSQYSVINNAEVLETVESLSRGFGHTVKQVHMDERGVWVKLLVDDLVVPDPTGKGSELKVGIMFGNSEVGCRALTVEPFVYRKVCTNDLVVQGEIAVSLRHAHLRPGELRRRVGESVNRALKGGDELLDHFLSAREVPVEDPAEVIRRLAEKRGLSQKLADEVRLAHAAEGSERNAFALVNAFTQAARALEGDERVELERFAGGLLDDTRWAAWN